MNTEKTVVVFRRWPKKEGGGIIALFPYEPNDRFGIYCTAYGRDGGHSGADYRGLIYKTKPVKKTDPEVRSLIKELKRIGYNLEIRFRATNDFEKRKEAIK